MCSNLCLSPGEWGSSRRPPPSCSNPWDSVIPVLLSPRFCSHPKPLTPHGTEPWPVGHFPSPHRCSLTLCRAREFCTCPAQWSCWQKVPHMPRWNVQNKNWDKVEMRLEQQVQMFGAVAAMPFPKQNVLCPFFSFPCIPNITTCLCMSALKGSKNLNTFPAMMHKGL